MSRDYQLILVSKHGILVTMQKILKTICITLIWLIGSQSYAQTVSTTSQTIKLGQTATELEITRSKTPGPTFIHLHEDEKTAYRVAKLTVAKHGGTLIAVKHQGSRLITFKLDGKIYRFDPNRIFTPKGITDTLKKNGNYSSQAQDAVKRFADLITAQIQKDQLLVAMHNNRNKTYSLRNYKKNGDTVNEVKAIQTDKQKNDSNFFLVTDESIFQALKKKNQNVILQDNQKIVDDGALSVFAAIHHLSYINIEAKRAHFTQQLTMVEKLLDNPTNKF